MEVKSAIPVKLKNDSVTACTGASRVLLRGTFGSGHVSDSGAPIGSGAAGGAGGTMLYSGLVTGQPSTDQFDTAGACIIVYTM